MSISDFENMLFLLDDIRIVIRTNKKNKIDNEIKFKEKCSDDTTLEEWLKERVYPFIGDKYDVLVITGFGTSPHMYTKLSTIRNSYIK